MTALKKRGVNTNIIGNRVLIATSIGPGKEYTIDILKRTLPMLCNSLSGNMEDVLIVQDSVKDSLQEYGDYKHIKVAENYKNRVSRIAYIREQTRQYFLSENKWDYIYWHDADMIPPKDIIQSLLSENYEGPISGVTCIREDTRYPIIPMLRKTGDDLFSKDSCLFYDKQDTIDVAGVGHACMLVPKDVIKEVGYREPEWYETSGMGEDYQWCLDVHEKLGLLTRLMLRQIAWHCDEKGCNRPVLGELKTAVISRGSSAYIHNVHGTWRKDIPVFDIRDEVKEALNASPEFDVIECRDVSIERQPLQYVLNSFSGE